MMCVPVCCCISRCIFELQCDCELVGFGGDAADCVAGGGFEDVGVDGVAKFAGD